MNYNNGIIFSNGAGDSDSIILQLVISIISLFISIFCFWVSGFDWAMWFWDILALAYGICFVISFITAIIMCLDNNK